MNHADDIDLEAHFQQLYLGDADPWQVCARWYEQRKRALVLAALSQPFYSTAYEPGCGNGELTIALAPRCGQLIAADAAPAAIDHAHARWREAGAPENVAIALHTLPRDWPTRRAPFDLIVISELAYYLPTDQLDALAAHCAASLARGGDLLLCHYRPPFADRVQSTEAVHATFARQARLQRRSRHDEAYFLIDVYTTNQEFPCSA